MTRRTGQPQMPSGEGRELGLCEPDFIPTSFNNTEGFWDPLDKGTSYISCLHGTVQATMARKTLCQDSLRSLGHTVVYELLSALG
jgi:hypothetical protein